MAATLASQLASVQAAIAKIEGGSASVTIDGMSLTRADLATLYARESTLLQRITRESTGASRTVCEF